MQTVESKMPGRRAPRALAGFTLLELMIVVAIIAILAAIAFPTYEGYVRQARRSDAESALAQLSQAMEQYYAQNYSYIGTADSSNAPTSSVFPYAATPENGTPKFYNLVITSVTKTSYVLNAQPIAGTDQTNDDCGTLIIKSDGTKSASGSGTSCW